MYPRLFIARNLLSKNGVIFISIDDNEIDNLKKICNEVFGEENFVSNIIWEESNRERTEKFSIRHDYILMLHKV